MKKKSEMVAKIKNQMAFVKFKLSDMHPAEYNPRKISDEALAGLTKSLERFGVVEPIIVNIRDGRNVIVGGHQRHRALAAAGVDETDCVTVDLSIEDEKLLNITLNNPHISGEFIDDLNAYLVELKELIDDDQAILDLRIDTLLGEIETGTEGLTDADAVPDAPKVAVTKPGDLYLLGEHRLLCGDSTNKEDVKGLMGGGYC